MVGHVMNAEQDCLTGAEKQCQRCRHVFTVCKEVNIILEDIGNSYNSNDNNDSNFLYYSIPNLISIIYPMFSNFLYCKISCSYFYFLPLSESACSHFPLTCCWYT